MNEDIRCYERRNMKGSGGGGGGVDGRDSPAPVNIPARSSENVESVVGVDLYSQAIKALSERSPVETTEVLANSSPTLPSVLANLLLRSSDSRKKHKKQNVDSKSSRKSSEKTKKSNIWNELEEYFRELTLLDIERLSRLSSSFSLVDSVNSCFTIPVFDNKDGENRNITLENDRVMPIDDVENNETENDKKDRVLEVKKSCSSIQWVLGSRNRVLLPTTRPSKKRKRLGENTGLERHVVAKPCEGSSSLCHVCSLGDTRDHLNPLVVCKSCNVVVHQKCYGVQGEITELWMCSWCKFKSDVEGGDLLSRDRPCVLCPKSGGALKRFHRNGSEGCVEFAHLFCCQWIPEVYIDDTRMMEPVLSVPGIKDERETLVCNLCEIKHGCCVRCSDGSCKASFHPLCAREARNKLEIWGKFGCDDIELRAFCGSHSGDSGDSMEKKDANDAVVGDPLSIPVQQGNKIKKLKICCKNGDKVMLNIGTADAITKFSSEPVSQEVMPKDIKSNTEISSGPGDLHGLRELKALGQKFQDKTQYVDLGVVLKKLLDRGKVSLQQIASEISVTEDSLATKLAGNHLGPEMSGKILIWLRDHAHMDTSEKDLRGKIRRLLPPKAELASDDHSDAVAIIDLDMPDVVPVKSVPPRRRTVGNIVKEEKVIPLSKDKFLGNDDSMDEKTEQDLLNGDRDHSSKDANSVGIEKVMVDTNGFDHPNEEPLPPSESIFVKSRSPWDAARNLAEEVTLPGKSFLMDLDQEHAPCSIDTVGHCDGDFKPGADSFVHPYIKKKLEEAQCLLVKNAPLECLTEIQSSAMGQAPTIKENVEEGEQNSGVNLGDLRTAKETGILDLSPSNEVEGEIIFSQQRLLRNAVGLKHHADQLVCSVVRCLPGEIDAVRKQRWDDVLVNQYISELKEARKQSRKERKHKEAQVVLAAATAAAAASSRVSSLRKDGVDESSQQENPLKVEILKIRSGLSSLPVSRPKEGNSSFDVPKAASDGSPKEHLKSCDICRRTESLLNPILVCFCCKVAVHSSCYRSVKESTGPWYCELCEEFSPYKASRSTSEKLYPIAECGLCGASNGAFRKSSDGEWIHAICAEWVFDSTFRRGQVSPVTGMETVIKGNDICSVCHRRFGVCIKCNNGGCQATFHPSCARSAGYYMYSKYVGGGKMQHKAYCSKHSSEHNVKAETQKHGAEDLKIVKQHRVELEKLRLLCERIVKREKLKRELALCNYDILASRQDSLPLSLLVRRPFLSHDVSSESATTSMKGHSRSCSEAMHKADDVTVDSVSSSKRCIRPPLSIDNYQKTDDFSTPQCISTPKLTERAPFAGKQIPLRPATTSRNASESGEKILKPKKSNDAFGKDMVMTPDQAYKRNIRLPKGYFYVPLDSLSTEKQVDHDSAEKDDRDGSG